MVENLSKIYCKCFRDKLIPVNICNNGKRKITIFTWNWWDINFI